MFTGHREVAVFTQRICQIDASHGVVGVPRNGFGIGGARRGAVTRFMQQRAQVVQRRAMRWLARKQIQIGVSGAGRAADFGQQTGALKTQRDGGGIGRQLFVQFLQAGFSHSMRRPILHFRGLALAAPQGAVQHRVTRLNHLFDQGIDLGLSGAVIDDGGANRQAAVDHRGRRRDSSGLMKIANNARIDAMRIVSGAITKAHNVQLNRRQQFQFGRLADAGFQITGQTAGARNHDAQCVEAINLQREPCLQGAETAREIRSKIAWPGRAARQPPVFAAQVSGGSRSGLTMQYAVAHQNETGVIGHLAPLVKVERQRIRALNSVQAGSKFGGQYGERALQAPSTWNQRFSRRERSAKALKSSIAPCIHAASRSDQQKGRKPGAAIGLNRLFEFRQIHSAARRQRDYVVV